MKSHAQSLANSKKAQCEREKKFIEEKRKGFNPLTSKAWKMLTKKFGPKIAKEEIHTLSKIISHELNIPLSREYTRRKELMIKWFDENYDVVKPFMDKRLILMDLNGHVIHDIVKEFVSRTCE